MNIYDLAFSLNLFKTLIVIVCIIALVRLFSILIRFEIKKRKIDSKIDDERYAKLLQQVFNLEHEFNDYKSAKQRKK